MSISRVFNNKSIEKYTSIQPSELKIVFWSFVYFFTLLASYFILRPLRDEMGIANGASNMQWLFTGTFLAMLVIVPVFGYLTSKFKIGSVLTYSYLFFIINILLFYYFFKANILVNTHPDSASPPLYTAVSIKFFALYFSSLLHTVYNISLPGRINI